MVGSGIVQSGVIESPGSSTECLNCILFFFYETENYGTKCTVFETNCLFCDISISETNSIINMRGLQIPVALQSKA
jgi:hypothetical protein